MAEHLEASCLEVEMHQEEMEGLDRSRQTGKAVKTEVLTEARGTSKPARWSEAGWSGEARRVGLQMLRSKAESTGRRTVSRFVRRSDLVNDALRLVVAES